MLCHQFTCGLLKDVTLVNFPLWKHFKIVISSIQSLVISKKSTWTWKRCFLSRFQLLLRFYIQPLSLSKLRINALSAPWRRKRRTTAELFSIHRTSLWGFLTNDRFKFFFLKSFLKKKSILLLQSSHSDSPTWICFPRLCAVYFFFIFFSPYFQISP